MQRQRTRQLRLPAIRNACLALTATFGAAATAVHAEPVVSPFAETWELTFTFENPLKINATGPGGRGATYWYIIYRVVNNTGEDRDFSPLIERVEEMEAEPPAAQGPGTPRYVPAIHVTPAMVGLDPVIFRAIQRRHARTHPFLLPPVEAIGRLKQGRDNAVDSVIVFPDLDPRVSKFTVFIGGLSGDQKRVPNPAYRPVASGKGETPSRWFVVQRTLAIPFGIPGDTSTRRAVQPALERLYWVFR